MLNVSAIPAFNDNYIWCIIDENRKKCAIVDPGDATPVLKFCQEQQLTIEAILITHHHADHQGGVRELLAHQTDICVYGPASEAIRDRHVALSEGDQVTFGDTTFNVFDVPGHTRGHIAYYTSDSLFCGDTLFSGGCGRLFEGTPAQMLASLSKLRSLPENTRVFCAHEYTQANLAFAQAVEPNNQQLTAYVEQVNARRASNQSTIPTSIGLEHNINPFLRWDQPSVIAAAQAQRESNSPLSDTEVFATIRGWKDNF